MLVNMMRYQWTNIWFVSKFRCCHCVSLSIMYHNFSWFKHDVELFNKMLHCVVYGYMLLLDTQHIVRSLLEHTVNTTAIIMKWFLYSLWISRLIVRCLFQWIFIYLRHVRGCLYFTKLLNHFLTLLQYVRFLNDEL